MADYSTYRSKRQKKNLLIQQLKIQRSSYEPQAKDIASYLLPYRHRLHTSDQNRGDRRNNLIYDSTASLAVQTLGAGFTSGMSDQTKRWVRAAPNDPELYEYKPARRWFDQVADKVLGVINSSNFYGEMPTFFEDMAGFGTAAISSEEYTKPNGKLGVHFSVYPFGTYWIAQDNRSVVDTFYTEHRMTVRQMYERFGQSATYSYHVKNLMDRGDWEEWVDVGHLIQPNMEADPTAGMSPRKYPFSSCWFELGTSSKTGVAGYKDDLEREDTYLLESGFFDLPVHAGRWTLTRGDVYGINCPGMTAVGDLKSLQIGEKRSWQAIEKHVNPHWVADPALRGQDHGFIPGEITWLSESEGQKKIRPIYEMNPQIEPLEVKLQNVKSRIMEIFQVPTFRMLQTLEDRERTATEIMQRKEEGMAQLAPTTGRAERDAYSPLLNRIYGMLLRREEIEPPPPEVAGGEFEWEFLGPLSQAQKLAAIQPIEQVLSFAGSLAAIDPAIMDNIDTDQAVQLVAAARGAPWSMIRDDDEVAEIRAKRAQQQQLAAMTQVVKEGAVAAKNLAAAPMDTKNALTKMTGEM